MDNASSSKLISLYRKRAKWYDWTTLCLYFAGFRHWACRERAIQSLALEPGDRVVDLGCGTGLNFSLLQEKVGMRGKIIGVELTDAMLDAAKARIAANGCEHECSRIGQGSLERGVQTPPGDKETPTNSRTGFRSATGPQSARTSLRQCLTCGLSQVEIAVNGVFLGLSFLVPATSREDYSSELIFYQDTEWR